MGPCGISGLTDLDAIACERSLPREVASWVAPEAGMFHWIRADWRKHPLVKRGEKVQLLELEEKIWKAGVVFGPRGMEGRICSSGRLLPRRVKRML